MGTFVDKIKFNKWIGKHFDFNNLERKESKKIFDIKNLERREPKKRKYFDALNGDATNIVGFKSPGYSTFMNLSKASERTNKI